MTTKTILVVGGYGAVGREVIAALPAGYEVLATGRHHATAAPVPGARLVPFGLDGVDVVLMCADPGDIDVAAECARRGIHYLDITADPARIAALESLDAAARESGAKVVLSVGLAPGATNLLARACAERVPAGPVDIGVLLGSGERHGPAAVAWTVDGLGRRSGSWPMRFPGYGTRTVHRFPFSDQASLPRTLGVGEVRTGLCLDSKPLSASLVLLGKLARFLPRAALTRALGRIHAGSDGFAAVVTRGPVRASLSGRRQSRATGVIAARLIARLDDFPPGVAHIDQVVEPASFLRALTADGFTFELGQGGDRS